MSGFLYRLGHRCARHPWRVLGVWLFIAVAFGALQSTYGGDYKDDFKVPGAESQAGSDLLKERFPAASGEFGRVVFHVDEGRIDSPENQALIHDAVAVLNEGENVSAATDPFAPETLAVSEDGRTAFSNVQYDKQVLEAEHYDHAVEAVTPVRDAGVQAEISGTIAKAGEHVEGNEMAGLIVAVIVLVVAFGSLIAAGIPLGTALLGLGVGLSAVGIYAGFFDVPTVSKTLGIMIGLGVGIDYALFVVTRHRQHLHEGMSVADSAATANATAGQAVLFAGSTVVIAIVGLVIAGLPPVTAMGFSTAIIVLVAMAAAVTMLPASLGLAGTKIDKLAIHRRKEKENAHETVSGKWAHHVGRKPWRYAIMSFVVLTLLAIPVFGLRIGMADDGNAAPSTTQRKSYDLLAEGFGPGFNGPFQIAVELPAGSDPQPTLQGISDAVADDAGIATVAPAILNESGDTAIVQANPTTSPQDEETSTTLDRLRTDVLPAAIDGTGAEAHVTGSTAFLEDVSQRISERLLLFIGAVVLLSFILLMIVFRSVLVPLKAAIMNMLSIGAAYGVIVMVFQWGWGKDLIGLENTVPVNAFVPMIMFAILFGLSMDYEVFLLSRVREEFLKHGDSHKSVVEGLASTARVITSAALIMISVFLGFVVSDDVTIKMFGLGLAVAVFLDATLVRMVLVPSTMSLMGGANWWLPKWLDRILPHLDLEAAPEVATDEVEDEDTERELEAA
jgi:RND superfamily putative drug exporter